MIAVAVVAGRAAFVLAAFIVMAAPALMRAMLRPLVVRVASLATLTVPTFATMVASDRCASYAQGEGSRRKK